MSSTNPHAPVSTEVLAVIADLVPSTSRNLATDADVAATVDAVTVARVAYEGLFKRARAHPENPDSDEGAAIARAMNHLENLIDLVEESVAEAFFRQGITRFRNRTGYRVLGHAVRKMRRMSGELKSLRQAANRVEELARATGDYEDFKLPHSRLALMETAPDDTRQRIDHLALVAEACGFHMRILFEPSTPEPLHAPHALLELAWKAMSEDQREMFYLLLRPLASRDTPARSEEGP